MNTLRLTGSRLRWAIFVLLNTAMLCLNNAWSQVDEIVVTARKTEESLQDVPMSVTAFSSQDIDRKGIRNISDVARLTSSIQFDESFAQSDTRIVVRGLSPSRGRQNVALLLDGIDVSSEAISSSGGSLLLNTRLVDIERIEVVLGPQMALYGRSAFNGAIQYITKDPSDSFETDLKFDVAENARYSAIASVSAPMIGDALGFRLNGAWWDEEGFYENSITGKKIGGDKGYGLALTFDSHLGDNLSFKLRTEYTDDEGQPSAQAFLPFNTERAVPLEATELLVDANGNLLSAGISECFNGQNGLPDFIGALSAGVPGNDEELQARTDRIMAANFRSQVAGSDLNNFLIETIGESITGTEDPSVPTGGISGYCEWVHPSFGGKIPGGDSLTVALAPNPSTPGVDYVGFDRELFRVSLVAEWSLENFTFASLTGFTRDDNIEAQDSNAYAFLSAEAGPFLDGNVNSFSSNNEKLTKQFSQELRFSTSFDGPVNGTIGGLYWTEDVDNDARSVTGQASGSHCMWQSSSGILNPIGIQDGCTGFTSTPVAPYLNAAAEIRRPSPADRNTDHWSAYGLLDIEFASSWTLTLEGRYNDEDVEVFGPIFFDPDASGGPGGASPCGIFFRACKPYDDWVAQGNWFADQFDAFDADDGAEFIANVPALCREQDPVGVRRSELEGPLLYEPALDDNGDQIPDPITGNPVPRLDDSGQPILLLDNNGLPIPNPDGIDVFNPWCVDSLKNSDSWFSPKVTLDWAASDDYLLYFSWSRARKPGGFNLLTVGSSGLNQARTEFKPEKMEVWEVGANSAWLDNTVIVNGAVFFQDFTDKQALTSALGAGGRLVSKTENAGSAETWGAEVSVVWQPIADFLGGGWRLSGGGTWLWKNEYTDFSVASGSSVNAAAAGNCTPTVVGDETLCTLSYTGNQLEDAPKGAFIGAVEYARSLSAEVDAFVETDVQWQAKRYTGVTNNLWTDAYWNFDLRLGVRNDRFEAMLYVDNVLDDDTVRFGGGGPGLGCCFVLASSIDLPPPGADEPDPQVPSAAVMVDLPLFSTAFLPPPRVVGVRWTYRFGN